MSFLVQKRCFGFTIVYSITGCNVSLAWVMCSLQVLYCDVDLVFSSIEIGTVFQVGIAVKIAIL